MQDASSDMASGRKTNGRGRRAQGNPRSLHELLAETLPPQDLDAERAILGSVLRDPKCLPDVVRLVQHEHFYTTTHQRIFRTMMEMSDVGVPIDTLTLGEELAKRNWLIEVGGAPAIAGLFEQTFTAANVLHYAKIVQDRALLRELIHASSDILRDSYQPGAPVEEIVSSAEKRIFHILTSKTSKDVEDIGSIMQRAFDRINDRQGRDGNVLGGLATGFYDLDESTNGWQPSELIILAARPSMGKTAMALNFVDAAAMDRQEPVLFISLEMSELELAERLLCARAEIAGHLVRRNRINPEAMQKLIATGNALSQSKLFIDDTPGQTMTRIASTARRLALQHGLKLIVIDYLQLIEPDDKSVPRQEQISTISRRLKNLARELKVPVIALSQLNRGAEQREGHRPRMSDLRESGSIEQDADVVLLLHRDDFYDSEKNPGEAQLIIAKQRNGPTGDIRLTFQKELTRFRNYSQPVVDVGAVDADDF